MAAKRRLVVAIDDTVDSEEAVKWTVANVKKTGDEIHLVHVVPRLQYALSHMSCPAPDIASLPFIHTRALVHMVGVRPVVHIVKFEADADSVGRMICSKAEELQAAVTVVARHSTGTVHKLLLGSVSSYCMEHMKVPLVVYRQRSARRE